MVIELNEEEIERLFKQEPSSEKDGGWQGLLVGLQHKLDRSTRMLELSRPTLSVSLAMPSNMETVVGRTRCWRYSPAPSDRSWMARLRKVRMRPGWGGRIRTSE